MKYNAKATVGRSSVIVPSHLTVKRKFTCNDPSNDIIMLAHISNRCNAILGADLKRDTK